MTIPRGASTPPQEAASAFATPLALDTTAPTVSAVAWTVVDKNNLKVTFTLSKPGTAKVKYGTAADLTGGTTIDATVVSGNNFSATFGVTRETHYYFQITATDTSSNSGSTLVKQVRLARTLNLMALAPATVTVTAAQDFQVGQLSVIAESADMKVTFVVTDTLAVTAP